jgi:choline/ethanolamine kinase
MEEPVLSAVRDSLKYLDEPRWAEADAEDVDLEMITGGLTNILYKATVRESPSLNPVLVRIFGISDGLLNRETENEIYMLLSAREISPRLLGSFSWGRLEEYLSLHRPLKSGTDMISVSPARDCVLLIAKALARLHQADLALDPIRCAANIFQVLRKWLTLSAKYGCTIVFSPKCPQLAPPSIQGISEEIRFIETHVREDLFESRSVVSSQSCQHLLRTVLCHNDLLSGNIMLDEEANTIRLIDFEYSGLNYAVADIANVFTAVCESIMLSGQPQDVEKNFPSKDIQLHFLACYTGRPVPPEDVETVLTLIIAFAMMDELRWTIWGIIQANQSTVDFDYVFYYNSRFDAYKVYKRLFLERMRLLGHQ